MADSAPPPNTTETPPPPDATASAPPPADTTTPPPPADTTVTPPPPDTSSSAPPPTATVSSPPPAVTTPPLPALAPPVAASPPPAAAVTPPAPQTAASPPPSSTVASPPPSSTTVSPPPPSSTPSTPSNSAAPPPSTTTASPPPAVLTPPPPGALHSAPPPSSLPSSPPPPTSSTNSTTPSTPTTPSTTTPSSPGGSSTNYSPPPPVSSIPSPPSDGGGLSTGAAAAVGVVVAAFVLAVVGICICYTRKKRRPHMEGYQQGYPNGFGMPNSAQFAQQGYPNSGEAPLMSSPSRATSAHYSSGLPPNSRSYNSSPYHSGGGPNYNSNGFSNNSNNSKNYSQGGKMKHSMTDLNVGSNQSSFQYEELYDITGGFAVENILGEGGFGCVYKGKLADGKEVAVKELKDGGGQGEREFQAEVEIISRVHHRHLVSLVGFCISEDHRLLVYDFVSNGTLHYHIHGKGRPCMEWSTRVKVAAGSARGLAYLHEDCHPKIIHRDIKSANILIDDHFEAQVADFGLARLTDTNATHVSTRVMGTFGYLAPEYASTGKLTDKSDVFSFGVVLLELITGRKPVDGNRPVGEESLVEWARPLLGQALESGDRDFKELVDPKLGTNYKEVEMFRMIETAAACIRHSASRRPKMSQVVRVLDSLTDEVDISNGVQPGKSQMFNVANTADIRLFQKMAFGSQEFSSDYSHTQSESSRNF
ncbi:hypothetical protein LUZ60_012812 [Juncus effusus]|nr:hypothetical protein LUZ60_012812 [Juncus effusus]